MHGNRLEQRIAQLRRDGGQAFVASLMAGEPSWPSTLDIVRELDRVGVTAVELGVPFSDPIADGPVIQAAGNRALARRYESVLTRAHGVTMVDIDRDQIRLAAYLRARHRVRTPDALQLSAALSRQCGTFLTNDRAFPELPDLNIVQLNDYVER